jgi:ribonucleotide reductase beta subunit family protein with ferritin-like domain
VTFCPTYIHVKGPTNLKGGLWFFVSFRIFFSDNTRSAKFFLRNLTLDYMTKTLNQIIFFFLNQNQNIFFSNIGNQNIFLEKNHNPPFKLNGRSLSKNISCDFFSCDFLSYDFLSARVKNIDCDFLSCDFLS